MPCKYLPPKQCCTPASSTDVSYTQVRTEGQLLADPGVQAAAAKTDILFCAGGVRQQEAVEALRGGAPSGALQLAFDSDPHLEAANRLQVCNGAWRIWQSYIRCDHGLHSTFKRCWVCRATVCRSHQ